MVLKSKQQKESYFNFETRLSYYEVTSAIVIHSTKWQKYSVHKIGCCQRETVSWSVLHFKAIKIL